MNLGCSARRVSFLSYALAVLVATANPVYAEGSSESGGGNMHQQATNATEAVLARLVDFHIADTDTTTALIAFGEQAELSVLISQDARDASTTGLIGTFPIAEALERLLEGTGLEHWMEGPAVVISRRVAEVHVASDAAPDDEGRGQSDGRSPLAALVRWSARALAAVVAAGGTPALAEAHDQTDTVDVIEEIVVTGLRRESTVQEAPAAISAIGAGELQDRGIVNPDDLKFAVPSMNFTKLGYGANISIRGIGAFNGQPGVALTTDGIYQSRDSSAQLSTLDLARIEVLRGPQGTLYGRNSVGGVVNYITAAPSQDPNGHVRLGLSEYEEWTMEGAYGAPISANTRFRAAFSVADKGEGFTRNLSAGAYELGVGERQAFRLKVDSDLHDALNAGLVLATTTTDGVPAPYVWLEDVRQVSVIPNHDDPLTTHPRKVYQTVDQYFGRSQIEQEYHVAALTLNLETPLGTIKSVTAHQEYDLEARQDRDALEFDYASQTGANNTKTFTQELSLNIANERMNLLAGAFYWDDRHVNESLFHFDPVVPVFPGEVRLEFRMPGAETVSRAIFADVTFDFGGRSKISLGVRQTEDEWTVRQNNRLFLYAIGGGPGTCVREVKREYSSTTARASYQYSFDNGNRVYATYSDGYKAGGLSFFACDAPYNPEEVESVEIGFKGLLGERTSVNATVFQYDYTDFQLLQVIGVRAIITNAGGAELTGVEVESVTEISDRLSLSTGFSYIDSQYKDFVNFSGVAPQFGFQQAKGNPLNNVPEVSLNLGIRYALTLASGHALSYRLDVAYRDDTSFSEFDEDKGGYVQDAYTVVDLNVVWESVGGAWRSRFFVKNLTDEDYVSGYNSGAFNGGKFGAWGNPRVMGVEVQRNF